MENKKKKEIVKNKNKKTGRKKCIKKKKNRNWAGPCSSAMFGGVHVCMVFTAVRGE